MRARPDPNPEARRPPGAVARRASAVVIVLLAAWTATPAPAASGEADRQFTFAARLMQQGETKLATEAFTQFVARHADDARLGDAHYYLAVMARQRGDSKAAAAHLAAAIQPRHIPPEALHLLRGQVKLESGDAPAAAADLERIDPGKLPDAESRAVWSYLMGAAYRGTNQLQAAATRFDQASEAESSVRGAALLELGKARLLLHEPGAAIEALVAAANDPTTEPSRTAEARSLAADVCYQQGLYENAAELYRHIVEHQQTTAPFPTALIGLLRSLFAAGRDEQVIQRYDALAKLLPAEAHAESLYLLGAAQVRLQRYAPATAPLLEFHNRYGSGHRLSHEVAYLYAVCYFHTDPQGFERWFASLEKDLPTMPQRHDLRYLRAQAAVKRGKPQEAAAYLTPLITEPDSPYLAAALLERAALYEQLKQTESAAADYADYARRFAKDPKAAAAGKRAVDLAFADGRFDHAAALAEGWLREPREPRETLEVRFKLGIARLKLNEPEAALAELDAVLAGKPDAALRAQAMLYRGYLLAGRDKAADHAAAAQSIEQAVAGPLTDPQKREAFAVLGQLHRMLRRDAESLDAYQKLRDLGGPASLDERTLLWIGRACHEQGRHDAAIAWLNDVIERRNATPDVTAEALFLAARSLEMLQRWDAAAQAYVRSVAFGKGHGEPARLGLARCGAAAGRIEDALEQYDALINVESSAVAAEALLDSAMLRWELAGRLTRAGDAAASAAQLEEARKRLSRVVILYDLPQLDPVPVRAMTALGRLLVESGDRTRGLDQLQQAATRAGTSGWALAARAESALASGQRGDGVFLLRKAAESTSDLSLAAAARRRLIELGETP